MDAENLYRRIGRLIEVAPEPPRYGTLSPELMKWVGQAAAIVQATGDILLQAEMSMAIEGLKYPNRFEYFQTILVTLYKALAAAELKAPPSAQGAFIPVGNSFDAFSAVAKILGSATTDVLLVDPYMDDSGKCHRQADTKGGTNRQGECRKQIAERERAGEPTGAVIGLAIAAGRIA